MPMTDLQASSASSSWGTLHATSQEQNESRKKNSNVPTCSGIPASVQTRRTSSAHALSADKQGMGAPSCATHRFWGSQLCRIAGSNIHASYSGLCAHDTPEVSGLSPQNTCRGYEYTEVCRTEGGAPLIRLLSTHSFPPVTNRPTQGRHFTVRIYLAGMGMVPSSIASIMSCGFRPSTLQPVD